MAEGVEALGLSLRGYRAAFTRLVNRVDKECRWFMERPSAVMATELENLTQVLAEKHQAIQDKCSEISGLMTEDRAVKIEKDADDNAKDYIAAMESIRTAMAEYVPAPTPAPPRGAGEGAGAGARGTHQVLRTVNDLKPETLTFESTPEVMRVWRERFEAYHRASKIGVEEPTIRMAFLKATLDIELQRDLAGRVDPAEDQDIEAIANKVEEIFKERYPIFTRRLKLFSARQKP